MGHSAWQAQSHDAGLWRTPKEEWGISTSIHLEKGQLYVQVVAIRQTDSGIADVLGVA